MIMRMHACKDFESKTPLHPQVEMGGALTLDNQVEVGEGVSCHKRTMKMWRSKGGTPFQTLITHANFQ